LRIYTQGQFAAPFLDRFPESMVGQKLSALQSHVRVWRRLSRSEVAFDGRGTVGMTIAGNNRIVEGVKGEWANKVFRNDEVNEGAEVKK
jgi:hypothetical protein